MVHRLPHLPEYVLILIEAMTNSHRHDHAHAHAHDHHHHAPVAGHERAFLIAIILNSIFVAVEFTYGLIADSTALMADAGHNLSDVLALGLAWGAALLAKRQPSNRYTYGLRSSSIIAALLNAMLLLLVCGAIAWEAVRRFAAPEPVAGMTVAVVAAIGIVINGGSALLFMAGSKNDLNLRGAYLHMAADAAVSLGVLIAGVVMLAAGWTWPDPVISLVIVAVVLFSTWGLLRDALQLSLNAVPPHIDPEAVAAFLAQQPGVVAMHDLHIWGMSTTESALTVSLEMPQGHPGDAFIDELAARLEQEFAIHHSTLQIRQGPGAQACALIEQKSAEKSVR